MTINGLTTKQLTEALKFVTGQPPRRFASRDAGLKRLQREMGAHGVMPQEVLAALGLSDPEPIEDDGLVLREEGDSIVARDAETGQFWADGTDAEEVRENARQQMAAYEEHCRKETEEPEPRLRRDRHGFVRRVRAPKEVRPKAAGKAELILELLTRPGGATHEEFKQATGWARCQSYPKQVARRHGLIVTTVREGRTARYTAQRAG